MRSSVGPIILRNLAVLALVHKAATRMNIKEIISDFANAKAQKRYFQYRTSLPTSLKRTDV